MKRAEELFAHYHEGIHGDPPLSWGEGGRFRGLEALAKNLVIIGGGAAGPSVAAEAKRGDPSLNITILEQGEHVSYTA